MNGKHYKPYSIANFDSIEELHALPAEQIDQMRAVATVLPFRTNNYIVEELIDWSNIPEDPIFQLTFPQPAMLHDRDLQKISTLLKNGAPEETIRREKIRIQKSMNPQPAGQLQLNVPREEDEVFHGMQHKYDETVLFFPKQGQTCHAFCTYCFRWAQFIGIEELKMATPEVEPLIRYLDKHPEVTDLLITGGDPLFMTSALLRRYIEPILKARPGKLKTIRIGTKALAYWPYRFLTDRDSEDLIRLFGDIVEAGYHLSIMAHFTHLRELSTGAAEQAIKTINGTGAVIRCQSPLIRHINDDPDMWARMWVKQVSFGMIPYYMFIARDTGPKDYFDVPLEKALRIFSDAYRQVSGLARTVRGPSMSTKPGKILVDGITEIEGKKYFVLKVIQGREASWVNRIFHAGFDKDASWLDDLKPAFGKERFFFEKKAFPRNDEAIHIRNAAMEVKTEVSVSVRRGS